MGKDKETKMNRPDKQHQKTERQPKKQKQPHGIAVSPDFKDKLVAQVRRLEKDFGID